MDYPITQIHNGLTNEVIERPMTESEYQAFLESVKLAEKNKADREQAQAKKAVAEAKLAALGLTTDDLRALGL